MINNRSKQRDILKNKRKQKTISEQLVLERVQEGLVIFALAFAAFLLVALGSYHLSDPGWSHIGMSEQVANGTGRAGAWIADFFLYFFGYVAYLFPLLLGYSAWLYFRSRGEGEERDYHLWILRGTGFLFIVLAGTGLISLALSHHQIALPEGAGGVLGRYTGLMLAYALNITGSILILLAVLLSGITLCTGLSWLYLVDNCGYYVLQMMRWLHEHSQQQTQNLLTWLKQTQRDMQQRSVKKAVKPVKALPKKRELPRVQPQIVTPAAPPVVREVIEETPTVSSKRRKGTAKLPAVSLLDKAEANKKKGYSSEVLENMSREVEEKLRDFNVEAQVVAVHPGPVITRLELQLAPGVKVSKIAGLAKDLARSLSVISVRVVDVIPGKTVIGLELPNETREVVRLSEIISASQYQQARSPLSLSLGKDIAGHPVVVDLCKMPHLLVAGTTGAGKSVGLNAMLLSLLYKATPEEVRLILIDPKMLELSIYDGIPHLLTPVVTDMKEANSALRWCVAEMERRYKLMSALGVRNCAGYNNKVEKAAKEGKPIPDPFWKPEYGGQPEVLSTLPLIVVVIDELADMMMVVGKKVESLIARIAQKARAAGIHMILATQRPSVDVLTGLIKANIPTRIAFQVSSKIDSRTVLDQGGAEQLLGYGDMLYLAPGAGIPTRVHGAFVDDHEVHNVVKYWQRQGTPDYAIGVTEDEGADGTSVGILGGDAEEADPLYDQAVAFVLETRRASISSVQRRLKIGYNRAARIIEQMEKAGLVSPMEGNGNREILVPAREK